MAESGTAVPVAAAVEEKSEMKQILVFSGERKRAVEFSSGATVGCEDSLLSAIKEAYNDVLELESNIALQQMSEVWDGEFVDVGNAASIADHSIVKIMVCNLQIDFALHLETRLNLFMYSYRLWPF